MLEDCSCEFVFVALAAVFPLACAAPAELLDTGFDLSVDGTFEAADELAALFPPAKLVDDDDPICTNFYSNMLSFCII